MFATKNLEKYIKINECKLYVTVFEKEKDQVKGLFLFTLIRTRLIKCGYFLKT